MFQTAIYQCFYIAAYISIYTIVIQNDYIIIFRQNDFSMHTEFMREDKGRTTAFSFTTNRDSTKVYLVPISNSLSRIETKVTDEPQYFFLVGSPISRAEVEEFIREDRHRRRLCCAIV